MILTIEDVREECFLGEELETLMNREEMKWAREARNNVLVLGDRNTKYFQTLVKQRRARNCMIQIKTADGVIFDNPTVIKNTILSHFRLSFASTVTRDQTSITTDLSALPIPKLSPLQRDLLNKPITNEEIESIVF